MALPACAPSPFDPPEGGSLNGASTPGAAPAEAGDVAIGSGFQARHRVPPSWFLTTSTVYSAPWPRVCCTPLPALGFVALPVARARLAPPGPKSEGAGGTRAPFPATRTPFEGFPSSAAVPHRCGHCLRAVAACPTTRRPKPRVPKCPKARPAAHEARAGSARTRRTDSVGRCRRNRSSDSAGVTPLNPHVVSARSGPDLTVRAPASTTRPTADPHGATVAGDSRVLAAVESSRLRGLPPLTSPLSPRHRCR